MEFLKRPERFTAVGARIPKGVLLVGPPGTGTPLTRIEHAGWLCNLGRRHAYVYSGACCMKAWCVQGILCGSTGLLAHDEIKLHCRR